MMGECKRGEGRDDVYYDMENKNRPSDKAGFNCASLIENVDVALSRQLSIKSSEYTDAWH